jgi:ATP-binding cassette subfamily B protein IrtA
MRRAQDASPDKAFRELAAPVRGTLAVAAVLQAVAAVLVLVPFAAVYELAERALDGSPGDGVWVIVGVAAGAAVTCFVVGGAAVAVSHSADARLALTLRRRIADHLRRVPLGWFTAGTSGSVQGALQDDLDEMHYAVAHARLDLVSAVVTPLAALVWLVTISWQLSLLTLLPVIAFLAAQRLVLARAGGDLTEVAMAMRNVHASVVEFVQGIAVVKMYGRSRRAHGRFVAAADDFHQTFTRVNGPVLRLVSLSTAVVAPVAVLTVVLAGGTALVAAGVVTPIEVLPFLLLGLGLTAPIQALGQAANGLRAAEAAAGRVRDLLATPELPEPGAPREPSGGRVEFDDVTFSHSPGTPVLSEVSAALEPGTLTALVGPSGAGKSTMAGLAARFFDVDSGAVRIGGVDVREIATGVLYRHVGFVLQDAPLLRTTVEDNIRLGRAGASADEVRAAARAANLHEVVAGLPRGYASVVGEDANLSGGEAQRMAVARLLLADPAILILDEATAYADPDSEAAVQDALSRLSSGRTVLVIAHRLATVVGADQILVLDGGRVVDRGRHEDLAARDGTYRRLWKAQGVAQ